MPLALFAIALGVITLAGKGATASPITNALLGKLVAYGCIGGGGISVLAIARRYHRRSNIKDHILARLPEGRYICYKGKSYLHVVGGCYFVFKSLPEGNFTELQFSDLLNQSEHHQKLHKPSTHSKVMDYTDKLEDGEFTLSLEEGIIWEDKERTKIQSKNWTFQQFSKNGSILGISPYEAGTERSYVPLAELKRRV